MARASWLSPPTRTKAVARSCCCDLWRAGMWSSSLTTWPNSEFNLLAMTSRTEERLVWSTTSVFLTKSCQRIPRIIRWQRMWKASSFHRSSCRSVHVSEPYNKMDSIQVWYRRSIVCQTLFIDCMAVVAMPMRLIMSGWHLPEVDRTDPRYVNSVTSSSEWPQTGGQGVDSPAPRFWIFVFCQDICKPSCDAVVSKTSRAPWRAPFCEQRGQRHLHNPGQWSGRCPVKNQFWRRHAPWSNQLRDRTEQEREHRHRKWLGNWGRE